jgi:hypothetical protein
VIDGTKESVTPKHLNARGPEMELEYGITYFCQTKAQSIIRFLLDEII